MKKLILATALVAAVGLGLAGVANAQSTQGKSTGKYTLRFPVQGLKAVAQKVPGGEGVKAGACPAGVLAEHDSWVPGPAGTGSVPQATWVVPPGCTVVTFTLAAKIYSTYLPADDAFSLNIIPQMSGEYRLPSAAGTVVTVSDLWPAVDPVLIGGVLVGTMAELPHVDGGVTQVLAPATPTDAGPTWTVVVPHDIFQPTRVYMHVSAR